MTYVCVWLWAGGSCWGEWVGGLCCESGLSVLMAGPGILGALSVQSRYTLSISAS